MNEFDEAAERRKKKAEYVDRRVRDMLLRLLMTDFRLTLGEYNQEIEKRNKRLKKGQLADLNRDDDKEVWLEGQAIDASERVAMHIINFLREQITKDDR